MKKAIFHILSIKNLTALKDLIDLELGRPVTGDRRGPAAEPHYLQPGPLPQLDPMAVDQAEGLAF